MQMPPPITRSLPSSPSNTVWRHGTPNVAMIDTTAPVLTTKKMMAPASAAPTLAYPGGRVLAVQQREHECAEGDRGHHPADVEGRPCHGAASDALRNDHGDGEHEHRQGGRHEQDEQHEEGLVDVDGVGTLGRRRA